MLEQSPRLQNALKSRENYNNQSALHPNIKQISNMYV